MKKSFSTSEPATKLDLIILKTELESKMDDLKVEIGNKLTKVQDKLLTAFDPLLQELENRRLDREIGLDQTARIIEQVEKLEERVTKLETPQTA